MPITGNCFHIYVSPVEKESFIDSSHFLIWCIFLTVYRMGVIVNNHKDPRLTLTSMMFLLMMIKGDGFVSMTII